METWNDPVCLAVAGLALLSMIASLATRPGRTLIVGMVLLALASLGLVASLAHPGLMPVGSMVVHLDGSTGDPRLPAALLVGLAALASLVPLVRGLGLPPLGALGIALPGVILAGLVASIASFAGLRQPMAIAGVALGSLALGAALALSARLARRRHLAFCALVAAGASLLVVAGTLSVHGARAGMLELPEGGRADTLGWRVAFRDVRLEPDSAMAMDFDLIGGGDTLRLVPALRARPGADAQSRPAARLLGGPMLVPLALHEHAPDPHAITWLGRGDSARAGDSILRFRGFRMVPGEAIRFYADLDWTAGARHGTVSPGLAASAHGEEPFAATLEGVGPIALARIDADAGRVGLVLPAGPTGRKHVAIVELRLRPALPWAWAGAALAVLALLLAALARDAGAQAAMH